MEPIDYTPDMLDDVAADRATVEPEVTGQWAATKIVTQLRKERETKGMTQSDVAAKMGVTQQRVADIERRPWSASFARILSYAEAIGATVSVTDREPIAA